MVIDRYGIAGLFTIASSGALAIFSFIASEKRRVVLIYAVYTLFIFLWSVLWFGLVSASDSHRALFFGRFLHLPAIFVPFLFLIFVQSFLNIGGERSQKRLRLVLGAAGLCLMPLVFHPSFVADVVPKCGLAFYVTRGPAFSFFTLYFFVAVVLTFGILFRGYSRSEGKKRHEIGNILAAYGIGYIGAMTVFLPDYGISIPAWPIYLISIAHLWMFYAVTQRGLLGVRILVRRVTLLMGIYAALCAVTVPALFYFHEHVLPIPRELDLPLIMEVLLIGALFSIGSFLYAFFVRRSSYFHRHTIVGLTHELKTPLAAIQSAIDLLNSSADDVAARRKDNNYLEMIHSNTERLERSVNNLMQALGENKSRNILVIETADLRQLCEAVLDAHRTIADRKGVKIVARLPGRPVDALIDIVRMKQVLSNLVSNAVKFTDRGSVRLTMEAKPTEIEVSVSDTGSGLPAYEVPKVFDRFYQGAFGKKKGGTGIGLTIAKAWVEAHGGKIWAESEGEGKGTTVTFTLPVSA